MTTDPTRLTAEDLAALRAADRVVNRLGAEAERLLLDHAAGKVELDPTTADVLRRASADLFRASRTLSDAPRWADAWRRWRD